jgi:azurin|tara:strand:- start:1350 stop:1826 length:477 start_codon:yes stop_codon:yes gene_type:complete
MKLTAIATTCAFLTAMGISHANAKDSKDGKVDQTVTISGNDTMQFDVKTFEVKAGSKVKIVLKNIGVVPKIAMGHNIVILKKGITAIAFGQKALGAGANATNALPDSLKGDVIASTKLLGPGETDSVVMKAPSETGTYEYVCTFPGHFALMRGVMTVK